MHAVRGRLLCHREQLLGRTQSPGPHVTPLLFLLDTLCPTLVMGVQNHCEVSALYLASFLGSLVHLPPATAPDLQLSQNPSTCVGGWSLHKQHGKHLGTC